MKSTVLKYSGAVVLLFLFIAPYTLININTLEDNIWFKPALDIASGQTLFRQTFSPYGMLVPLLQGLTVKIFGEYLLPLRLEAAFFYAMTGIILYFLWSRYMPKLLASASVVFWLLLAPFYDDMLLAWSSIYALVFQSLGFLFLVLHAETHKKSYMFWSGVMVTLTILTRQPVGVFLGFAAVSSLLFSWVSKSCHFRKVLDDFLYMAAGCLFTFLPFFIHLILSGSLSDWWIQSFVFAAEYAKVIRGVSIEQLVKSLLLGRYFKIGEYQTIFLWLAIPLSSLYFLGKPILLLIRKEKIALTDRKLFLAGIVCIGSWMQYYPMTEPTHFFWAVTPIVGFFLLAAIKLFLPPKKRVITLYTYLLFCLITELLLMRVVISYQRFRNTSVYSTTLSFLKNIRISSYENMKINSFHTALTMHLSPSDTYINISDDAMIPLLDKRFYHIPPLYEQWNFFAERLYPDYYAKVNSYILSRRPLIVTRTLPHISQYCSLKNVDYPQRYMGIHLPAERVLKIKADGNMLVLIPSRDITITSVYGLAEPLHHFSVFDMKKINRQPVYVTGMPMTVRKDDQATITIDKITPQIIFTLDDPVIESCTYSINSRLFYK